MRLGVTVLRAPGRRLAALGQPSQAVSALPTGRGPGAASLCLRDEYRRPTIACQVHAPIIFMAHIIYHGATG